MHGRSDGTDCFLKAVTYWFETKLLSTYQLMLEKLDDAFSEWKSDGEDSSLGAGVRLREKRGTSFQAVIEGPTCGRLEAVSTTTRD